MLGLGIGLIKNTIIAIAGAFSSLIWGFVSNGDYYSFSTDNSLLTRIIGSTYNTFAYITNTTYAVANTPIVEWIVTIITPVANQGHSIAFSSINTNNDNKYGMWVYHDTPRIRMHENGVAILNIYSDHSGLTLKMLWNGSAMEYYVGGVLKVTGSYSHVGNLYLMCHTGPNTAVGETVQFLTIEGEN